MPECKLELKKIKGKPGQNKENFHKVTISSISNQKDMVIKISDNRLFGGWENLIFFWKERTECPDAFLILRSCCSVFSDFFEWNVVFYLIYTPVAHWMLQIINLDVGIPNNNHPCAVSWIHVVTYLRK